MPNNPTPAAPNYNDIVQAMALRSASPQTALDAQANQQLAAQLAASQQQGTNDSSNPLAFGANLVAALINRHRLAQSNQTLANDAGADQAALTRQQLGTVGMGGPSGTPDATASSSPQSVGAVLSGANPYSQAGTAQDVGNVVGSLLNGQSPSGAASANGPPTSGPGPNPGAAMSLPGPGAAAPPMPAPPQQQTAQGPPQGFGGAAAPAAGDATGRVGPAITPQDRDALIRMVYGEARGEPPAGQQATAAVALNRSILSGRPVAAVVSAPGQFEGLQHGLTLDPNSPAYQRIAAVVDPMLTPGAMADPSGGATHFYSPSAQAALGRQPPAWAQGQQGRQIGNQVFYNLASGSQPAAAGAAAGAPGAAAAPGSQLPTPQTLAPQGPQQDPQMVYGRGPTDQEKALIRQMMASPYQAMRDQGMQMIASIRQRMLTPIKYDQQFDKTTGQTVYTPDTPGEGPVQYARAPAGYQPPAPDKMMYGADGALHPIAGTADSAPVRVSPSATAQADPFGHVSYSAVPGLAGEAPAGTSWNGQAYTPLPGAGYTRMAGPSNAIVQQGPNGKIEAQAMPGAFTPEQTLSMRSKFYDSDAFKKYGEALSAYQGLRGVLGQMAGGNNGVIDTAAIDSYLRGINPGMGARNTTVSMFLDHLGLPQELQAHIASITGNGYLTPQTLQQMEGVINSYAGAHYQEANKLRQSDVAFAQAHGMGDPGEALEAPPAMVAVPQGRAQGGSAALPPGVTLQQVQAEIARRRALAGAR